MVEPQGSFAPLAGLKHRTQIFILLVISSLCVTGFLWFPGAFAGAATSPTPAAVTVMPPSNGDFILSPDQLAAIDTETVEQRLFYEEITTEGKIGVDEYQATPVFSPYPGRVIAIFARTGEQV